MSDAIIALLQVMRNGKIVQSGNYEDLIAEKNGELVQQMAAHNQSLSHFTAQDEQSQSTCKEHKTDQTDLNEGNSNDQARKCEHSDRANEEERESGRVKWQVYQTFVASAYKGALVPLILLCQVLFQGLQMSSNYWIAWATDKEDMISREKMIGVFVLLSTGSSLFVLGRAVLLTAIAIETAQRLFYSMMIKIFRAPIFFFDSTPSSRILNRVSFYLFPETSFLSFLHFFCLTILISTLWGRNYLSRSGMELGRTNFDIGGHQILKDIVHRYGIEHQHSS